MPSLRQVTPCLATAYGTSTARLEQLRIDMTGQGMLPAAKGRAVPQVTSERLALLVMALGVSNIDRIGELADLRAYIKTAGDMPLQVTLAQSLGLMIDNALTRKDGPLDATLVMTLNGLPMAWLERDGHKFMCWGERESHCGFIQRNVAVHLGPLDIYAATVTRDCYTKGEPQCLPPK